ncbi:MAG: Nif3-like dinuclear metal center hexameric protein [Deltaproteobacteria bacterium]|nr:Nif3-like dinuclear metal center hexameric protein [Deltaproteobacteria bacterium]MCW5808505.1 Nif3-like dinuclear metal center hexameric protein [Deltaproteobacteria bacterium]
MPVHLREVVGFLDTTLEIEKFRDFAPNGLQVEGAMEVDNVVTGVSASAELISRAIEQHADLIVVHHGLVWGSGLTHIAGPLARRLRLLLGNDVSLAAYHLPLDKHARLGNNVGLADALALGATREAFGDVRGTALGLAGVWSTPLSRDDAIGRVAGGVCKGQQPRFVFPYGPAVVRRVGVCTGAASDLLEAASNAGCDMFVTGELAERAGDLAKELQITLVAAGHYATEVFGPMRLADELRMRFPGLNVQFVPVPSPL